MNDPQIEALGDGALLIRLGDRVDAELNAAAHALTAALREADLPGIIDIAPAYASVTLRYDVLSWTESSDRDRPHARITRRIAAIVARFPALPAPAAFAAGAGADSIIEIPVCYGGEFGVDLDAVAAHASLPIDEVIARHAAGDYRVAMLGFMPGFAYLLGLDARLDTPRRASPRTRVPAGSVAIGGAQTGVYPRELPGGWQLIGRTPLPLFDPRRSPPALLQPGRRVRFRAIDASAFAALAQ